MFSTFELFLAAGVFCGNWALLPLTTRQRNFKESFKIGLLAALIVLTLCGLLPGQLGEM
ncbi:hypothetical protein HOB10_01995 [Candidatus Parcubacteria bacterium]|jgi:hypothetical protein|nr:hypothetical protein [Candidatus Parcubacteria bacterium]